MWVDDVILICDLGGEWRIIIYWSVIRKNSFTYTVKDLGDMNSKFRRLNGDFILSNTIVSL